MEAANLPSTISAFESRVASRKSSVRRSFSKAILGAAHSQKTTKITTMWAINNQRNAWNATRAIMSWSETCP